MIFQSIIALVLGVSIVALWMVTESIAGPWAGGIAAVLFALLAGPRMARADTTIGKRITLAILALLPVWTMPWFMDQGEIHPHNLPIVIAVTLALALGVAISSRRFAERIRKAASR